MIAAEFAYVAAQDRIKKALMAGATSLDLGVSQCRALTQLPPEIADLTKLQNLYLNDTQVSDLSALSELSALQTLWLNNTEVSDLSALSGLSALQTLWLNDTEVSDLSALSGLSALQTLGLNDTMVSDLSALSRMSALQTLWLDGTEVSDLRPVAFMRSAKLERGYHGIHFKGSKATRIDPRLAEISEIGDSQERLEMLFDYLEDWEPPQGDGATALPPSVPQERAAPISVEIVEGVLTSKAVLPLSDEQHEKLARDGWQALKTFRDTFGAAFDLHNHG
ncbi:leucine-rich repeat domain-containing protein [Tropicibacter sp. R15_0]|uniref:leucine-rich repeat domain-containing protein n=1 Tax=Tropicibacter sp. R15_0 TaxID=2821101 RepID=UPI001ADCFD68|nr:leucine-rich repeat domain-containing protein [Tropicibacter sp. R15_0]MBO9466361.1 leucine-rich repeat domain-containing protein [Tropicibacter sp. R15_0]